ncbi:MAG TPA: HAD-IIIA family hydrolase [Dehalococcoidia bacterium]|nr:HAD-IIIA family hydrolase [Dehalococcoidia bacterium]
MKPPETRDDGRVGPDGIWVWRSGGRPAWLSRQALFLDRDGVVLEFEPYLSRPEAVRLLPGAAETIAAANQAGVPVAVVTNQSGVGRGYYGWAELAAVVERMQLLLGRHGARVDAVFACPYHAEARPPYDRGNHPARKPNPGMLLRAGRELRITLESSWIVGDTADDLLAGRAAGLAGGVHVLSGLGATARERVNDLASTTFRVELATDLRDAAPRLLDQLTKRRTKDDSRQGGDLERRVA